MSDDTRTDDSATNELSKRDLFALKQLIQIAVDECNDCRFDVSQEEADNISHLGGLITSLRTKDTSGLDIMRDNHMWTRRVRTALDRVWAIMLTLLATSAGAGLLAALWQGLKAIIKE